MADGSIKPIDFGIASDFLLAACRPYRADRFQTAGEMREPPV
jgi:hypothetical protein